MAINRLKLDFKLETSDERNKFIEAYLQEPQFISRPPTADELEMIGNYILWGKNPKTGLNAQQEGSVTIDTKHKTWDKTDTQVESLDELMELPTFNEAALNPLYRVPTKVVKETFSRKEALAKCPKHLVPTFTDLFRRIDELDLAINYYDLEHGRRKNPPRPELLALFTKEEQEALAAGARTWNQFNYLKHRHLLVDLRREQYTLRDSYREPVVMTSIHIVDPNDHSITLGEEIPVLPLGLVEARPAGKLIFVGEDKLLPTSYSEQELELISNHYWKMKQFTPRPGEYYIDFRNLEHVYQIFLQYLELTDAADPTGLDTSLAQLMDTLNYYINRAELDDIQKEILDLKLKKTKNMDIAALINKKWGKSYTPNYISTIFRQRIIPKINEAAAYHEKVVSNLFFEEEFKVCSDCGRVLLRDPENFTRKSRAKDGYTSKCKKCEKIARNK